MFQSLIACKMAIALFCSLLRLTCELNEEEEGVSPTDSRRRPDQRYMENGQWDLANTEKVKRNFLICLIRPEFDKHVFY